MRDAIVIALEAEIAQWLGPQTRLSGAPVRLRSGESAECYRFEIRNPPADLPPAYVLMRRLGMRVARQFTVAYDARTRLDTVTLDFCRALHALRLIAIARTTAMSPAGVHRLWRSIEAALVRRWVRVTGESI